MTVLDVTGLELRRGERTIAHDVSFAAERGEIVALMGASGTGKTTVLRAIAGLEPFSGGTITIDGLRLAAGGVPRGRTRAELNRRVGMVFQFHHLFAHLPASHNVWLAPVHVLRQPKADAVRRAHALLDKLGVGERAGALPAELSGGEAQRVAIARALAMEPPLLLMDEPTASLDPPRRDALAETVRQLAGEGRTIVVATHDTAFARRAAHRVVMLAGGRVANHGPASELLA